MFLDLFDHEGVPFNGPCTPLGYRQDNVKGTLPAGGVEWMQAGGGMWHGGGLDKAGRTRGFQLWIALPPELELGPALSIYQAPEDVLADGPAHVAGRASRCRGADLVDQEAPRSRRPPLISRYVHIAAEDAKDVLQRMNQRILSTIKRS